jgi:hypothetical protein
VSKCTNVVYNAADLIEVLVAAAVRAATLLQENSEKTGMIWMADLAERLWQARKQGGVVRPEDVIEPSSTEEA